MENGDEGRIKIFFSTLKMEMKTDWKSIDKWHKHMQVTSEINQFTSITINNKT